jgi:hypothetical protein
MKIIITDCTLSQRELKELVTLVQKHDQDAEVHVIKPEQQTTKAIISKDKLYLRSIKPGMS